MKTILKIIDVLEFTNRRTGKPFYRTYALVQTEEGVEEAYGFGRDYSVGERVSLFFHYEMPKMQKLSVKNVKLDDVSMT